MRLVWILVFLTLSFVVPFLIWGSAFEDAFPRDGEWLKEKVSGFTAVIFQHEIDHLDGILFLDHLNKEK